MQNFNDFQFGLLVGALVSVVILLSAVVWLYLFFAADIQYHARRALIERNQEKRKRHG